jgi:hypothetical protein
VRPSGYDGAMSNPSNENTETPPDGRAGAGGGGISDEQLPEDLQPTDDNPLAQNPSQEEVERDKEASSGPAVRDPDADADSEAEGEPPGAVPRSPNA